MGCAKQINLFNWLINWFNTYLEVHERSPFQSQYYSITLNFWPSDDSTKSVNKQQIKQNDKKTVQVY